MESTKRTKTSARRTQLGSLVYEGLVTRELLRSKIFLLQFSKSLPADSKLNACLVAADICTNAALQCT